MQPIVNKGFTILVFSIPFLIPLFSLGTTVEVYSQAGCADCEWVQESFLPEAEARFGTNLESRVRDVAEKENFLRLLGVLDRAGLPRGQTLSAPLWIYMPDNTDSVRERLPFLPFNQELLYKIKNHAKLLAEAIPPRSNAAGTEQMKTGFVVCSSIDMNKWVTTGKWISNRVGISLPDQNNRWLHGDYKDAPPFLTWTLYKNIRTILSNPEQTSEESK